MYFLDFQLLCLNIECSFMFMNFVTFFKIWVYTHLHVKRGHLLNIYTCTYTYIVFFLYTLIMCTCILRDIVILWNDINHPIVPLLSSINYKLHVYDSIFQVFIK